MMYSSESNQKHNTCSLLNITTTFSSQCFKIMVVKIMNTDDMPTCTPGTGQLLVTLIWWKSSYWKEKCATKNSKTPQQYCYFLKRNSDNNMRPVPTKWETSRKISFESCKQICGVQILSFKMIYNMPGLLSYLGSKTHYLIQKFLCFLLIFEMFNEPYLL